MAAGAAAGDPPGAGVPAAIYNHALTVGFSSGLLVSAGVIFAAFVVGLVATRTPGPLRLSSAVHDREPSCDETLGTCEPAWQAVSAEATE
jgi:hypothetical protein